MKVREDMEPMASEVGDETEKGINLHELNVSIEKANR